MKRLIPYMGLAAAVGMTLAAGAIHGHLTNRWGEPPDLAAAAEKLQGIPDEFGDWQLRESKPLGEGVVRMLQCSGYINRIYANELTGSVVSVAILAGPPGPISVHTPEICYSSRDHTIEESPQRFTVRATEVPGEEFWGMTFRSNDLIGGRLRVCYAWSAGEPWSAPSQPRITFSGKPLLCKMQLATHLPPSGTTQPEDPSVTFLKEFLPVLDRAVLNEPAQ